MSIPSTATFLMNDGSTVDAPINIGWRVDEKLMPDAIRRASEFRNLNDVDWHSVIAYDRVYTKKRLNDITLNVVDGEVEVLC